MIHDLSSAPAPLLLHRLTSFLRFTFYSALDIRCGSSRLFLSCSPSFLRRPTYILRRISRLLSRLGRRILGRTTQIFRGVSRVVSGIADIIGITRLLRLEYNSNLLRCVA